MIQDRGDYGEYLSFNKKQHPVTLIKGQTALGKTTAYGIVMNEVFNDKFVIAVPTHELKEQIYNDLLEMGVKDIMKTPKLGLIYDDRIRNEEKRLMDIGAFGIRKKFLAKSIDTLKDKLELEKEELTKDKKDEIQKDIENISNYLEQNEIVNHYMGNIVTTQDRLFHLHWHLRYTHKLIIDEDILRKCITIRKFKLKTLKASCECLSGSLGKELKRKLDKILNAPYKKVKSVKPIYQGSLTKEQIEKIEEEIEKLNKPIYNIFDVLSINAIYKYNEKQNKMQGLYNDDDWVYCLVCRKIPNMTTFVLSATLESEFYEKYFEEKDIDYKEIPPDKYKGKVIQDCSYSFSRACLEKHPKLLDKIRNRHKGLPMITFKRYCELGDYNFRSS